jgi:hypothetical protein
MYWCLFRAILPSEFQIMWTCILFNLASILACQRPPFPNQSLSPHVQLSLPFPQPDPYHRPSLAAISPRVSYTANSCSLSLLQHLILLSSMPSEVWV